MFFRATVHYFIQPLFRVHWENRHYRHYCKVTLLFETGWCVRALSLYTLLASIRATDPCSWALNIGPRLTDFRGWDHTEEASIDGEGCEWQGQMRREMVGGPAGSRHTGIIVTGLPRPLCRGEPVTEKDMTAEVFINSLRWRFVMDLLPPFKSVTLNWRL